MQRVARAHVTVGEKVVGEIGRGLLVLLGATHADDAAAADWLSRKITDLRVFPDDSGHMNRSLREVGGAVLVVPQFTLYGDARRGRRPDFVQAARPEHAAPLFDRFCTGIVAAGVTVKRGVFGAQMAVELVNDGPVTLIVESPAPSSDSSVLRRGSAAKEPT